MDFTEGIILQAYSLVGDFFVTGPANKTTRLRRKLPTGIRPLLSHRSTGKLEQQERCRSTIQVEGTGVEHLFPNLFPLAKSSDPIQLKAEPLLSQSSSIHSVSFCSMKGRTVKPGLGLISWMRLLMQAMWQYSQHHT